MPYKFTQAEQTELLAARELCPADNDPKGNFVPLYQKLSEIIGRHIGLFSDLDQATQASLKISKLWIDVAIGANGGTGMHSAFIRGYTDSFGELMKGKKFTKDQMQMASNVVAMNFWKNLVANEEPTKIWVAPDITEIAEADASAIGRILYDDLPDDTTFKVNAGWSGALGFNVLGGKSPWESWRLISALDSGSEKNHGLAQFNSLDDLRNILFAVKSFDEGFKAGFKVGALEFAIYLLAAIATRGITVAFFPEDLAAQVNIAISSGKLDPFVKSIAAGSPVAPTVNFIADAGLNTVLDMLRRSVYGGAVSETITAEDFKANAFAFFKQLGNVEKYRIEKITDSFALPQQAKHDFLSLLALSAASAFKFKGDDSESLIKAKQAVLYTKWQNDQTLSVEDHEAGLANFSEQWLQDRAILLKALVDSAMNGKNSADSFDSNTWVITDKVLNKTLTLTPIGAGASDPMGNSTGVTSGKTIRIYFANDLAGDSFPVSDNDNHLYGGSGPDSLSGGKGDDYIEGGAGNDSLKGGAGNDILFGNEGNDNLEGGLGNDTLAGGAGSDSYQFNDGDGYDTIIDKDGQLKWGNDTLVGGLKIDEKSFSSVDGIYKFSKTGKDLLISKSSSSSHILLKNWTNGDLGIRIDGKKELDVAYTVTPVSKDLAYRHGFSKQDSELLNDGREAWVKLIVNGEDFLLPDSKNKKFWIDVGDRAWTILGNDADSFVEGGAANNILIGGGGSDTLIGGDGDDLLTQGIIGLGSNAGEDSIIEANDRGTFNYSDGGRGNDSLYGATGIDELHGGEGDDVLNGRAGNDILIGGEGSDQLCGDWLDGYLPFHPDRQIPIRAIDLIPGIKIDGVRYYELGIAYTQGNDYLYGGDGDDGLFGYGGADVLEGGNGDDKLFGDIRLTLNWRDINFQDGVYDFGPDMTFVRYVDGVRYVGRNGNLLALDYDGREHGDDKLDGGDGNDYLQGDGGNDSLIGGAGNDVLRGDALGKTVAGEYHGNDWLDGGDGNDVVSGEGGADTLYGGAGNDDLIGDGIAIGDAKGGNDFLDGGDGDDNLLGGAGADQLYGGTGDDKLYGDSEGAQAIAQNQGADSLSGGEGNDELYGQGGDDIINGGTGADLLDGGDGNDSYLLAVGDSAIVNGQSDTIDDDDTGNQIQFAKAITENDIRIVKTEQGDMALAYSASDVVIIKRGFAGTIQKLVFADGSTVLMEKFLLDHLDSPTQRNSDVANDDISGGRANDTIMANGGHARVTAGRGNDTISGKNGNNTYVFRRGDGADTLNDKAEDSNGKLVGGNQLELGKGIELKNLSLTTVGNSLKIEFGGGDAITLTSVDINDLANSHSLDKLNFADGSSLSFSQLIQQGIVVTDGQILNGVRVLQGSSVNDQIYGGITNERLIGGAGNDQLFGGEADQMEGGAGNDIYEISQHGNSLVNLTISDSEGENQIKLGMGFNSSDFSGLAVSDSKDITFSSGANTFTIKNGQQNIEHFASISFADGKTLDKTAISKLISNGKAIDGTPGDDEILAGPQSAKIHGYDGNDKITGNVGDDLIWGDAGNDSLMGGAGNDRLLGGDQDDLLDGGSGKNVLSGDDGNDKLIDGADVSILLGGEGNDSYQSGAGDDSLVDAEGSDIYEFNLGDGRDTIIDSQLSASDRFSDDKIIFGTGIKAGDLRVSMGVDERDLIIKYSDKDQVTIIGGADGCIEKYHFADGTQLNFSELLNYRSDQLKIVGDDFGNKLSGAKGNDLIQAAAGDDVLTGNAGNDQLEGGAGRDRYNYAKGDGADTILDSQDRNMLFFKSGISLSDIVATPIQDSMGNHLLLKIGSLGDEIKIQNLLIQANFYFVFEDGGSYSYEQFINATCNQPISLQGSMQDDVLYGGAAKDTFDGHGGHDLLIGGRGEDTYLFGLGSGQSVIEEVDGEINLLALKTGEDIANLRYLRQGDNLIVSRAASDDQLTIKKFFNNKNYWMVRDEQGKLNDIAKLIQDTSPLDSAAALTKLIQQFKVAKEKYLFDSNTGKYVTTHGEKNGGDYVTTHNKRSVVKVDYFQTISNESEIVGLNDQYDEKVEIQAQTKTEKYIARTSTQLLPGDLKLIRNLSVDETSNTGVRISSNQKIIFIYTEVIDAEGKVQKKIIQSDLYQTSPAVEKVTYYRIPTGYYTIEQTTITSVTVRLEEVKAGNADNHIVYASNGAQSAMVDGGDGNDFIDSGMSKFDFQQEEISWKFVAGREEIRAFDANPKDVEKVFYANSDAATGSFLSGGNGNDTILGSTLRDLLIGGDGNDFMNGGAMGDWYHIFSADMGWDTIYDSGQSDVVRYIFPAEGMFETDIDQSTLPKDTVVFGSGIDVASLRFSWGRIEAETPHQTLNISWADGRGVRIALANEQDHAGFGIERFEFADGSTYTLSEMIAKAGGRPPMSNSSAPVNAKPLSTLKLEENKVFSFTIPDDVFTDPDANDVLQFSVGMADGKPLPAWLKFDAKTKTFFGTPDHQAIGNLDLIISVVDKNLLGADTKFTIAVLDKNTFNHAPELKLNLPVQNLVEKKPFSLVLPDGLFIDSDKNDQLTLDIKLADGNPLPGWLSFDAITHTLKGTPDHAAIGDLALTIIAKDKGGLSAQTSLNLHTTVETTVNTAPIVAKLIEEQNLKEKVAFIFVIPADVIVDKDKNDVLVYSVQQKDGQVLPAWLSFDNATRTLQGTPATNNIGDLSLTVSAKDKAGLSVSTDLILHIGSNSINQIQGTDAADQLVGSTQADNIKGLGGADTLIGGAGNDSLNGGAGDDVLNGGDGDDQYYFESGFANELIIDSSGNDTLHFGAGISLNNLVGWIADQGKSKVAQIRLINADGLASEGVDIEVTVNDKGELKLPVENFLLSDGKTIKWTDLLVKQATLNGGNSSDQLLGSRDDDTIMGLDGNDTIKGGFGNDKLDGGNGDDQIYGGSGDDKLYGQSGDDKLFGDAGNDVILGGNGKDYLDGGEGNDTLQGDDSEDLLYGRAGKDSLSGGNGNDFLDGGDGDDMLDGGDGDDQLLGGSGNDNLVAGNGNDFLTGGAGDDSLSLGNANDIALAGAGDDKVTADFGNKLIDAGDGNDTIICNAGNHWYAGGKGDDVIDPGHGASVFSFNRGDGVDTYKNFKTGGGVLSLGKGIKFADVSLSKSANDLTINLGQGDVINLTGWYSNPALKAIERLQFLTEGADYDAVSNDKLTNKKVEVFDFKKLVEAFDAYIVTQKSGNWAIKSNLVAAHLFGSDTVAIGGDYSYQYASKGSLSGIGLSIALAGINSSDFVSLVGQTLHSRTSLESDTVFLQ